MGAAARAADTAKKIASVASKAAAAANAARAATRPPPAELHVVRLVRSPIGQTDEVRRTLRVLRLHRLQAVAFHKNTPPLNGMLRSVMHLVRVRPLRFAPDVPAPPGHDFFLSDDGVMLGTSAEDFIRGTLDGYQEGYKAAAGAAGAAAAESVKASAEAQA